MLCFLVSRICFYLVGVRFDFVSLNLFGQLIDPPLLRDDLLRSLWYLHNQPPLFNLYVGSILKLGDVPYLFTLSFHVLGLLMTIVLYLALKELRVSTALSFFFAMFFAVSPPCILYENWLFYTYPVTAFLTYSVFFLQRSLKDGSFLHYFLFASCLSIVILSFGFFHPAWAVVIFGVLLLIRKDQRKRILAAITVPLLAIVLVYGKNLYVFKSFTGSTWFGMNFARISTFHVLLKVRRKLVKEGALSPLALIPPFSKPSEYDSFLMELRGSTDYPTHNAAVLDSRNKSNGIVNYNWIGYIDISRGYWQDAKYVLAHNLAAYREGILHAVALYFLPASNYHRLDANREQISTLDRFHNRWIYGGLFAKEDPAKMRFTLMIRRTQKNSERSWFLIIGLPLLFSYGVWLCFQKDQPVELAVYFFICFTIAYVTIVGICFEVGENNRFRFAVESYFAILLAVLTDRLVKTLRLRVFALKSRLNRVSGT
jgi:hypothetical protein